MKTKNTTNHNFQVKTKHTTIYKSELSGEDQTHTNHNFQVKTKHTTNHNFQVLVSPNMLQMKTYNSERMGVGGGGEIK